MKNGWTGGQYSLFRVVFAAYLFVHNVLSLRGEPGFVRGLLALAALATIPLALGIFDRFAAILIAFVYASLFARSPLIADASVPLVGLLLLAHTLVPTAPYGSWKARGRADPGGGWVMPGSLFLAAWVVMASGYTYGGASKLVDLSWADGTALYGVPPVLMRLATWSALGFELLFAPLALSRRLRPWIWLAMVGMHLGLLVMVDFADLTFGMLLVHFFTFDPAWIPARKPADTETLFYDGTCALCHGAVRFALAEDRTGGGLRFAPLQGEAFKERIPEGIRDMLPDSLAVLTIRGVALLKSAAVLHLLAKMGGLWRVLAGIARPVPAPIRDAAYDGVARIRYRVFGKRNDLCPIVPAAFRSRFDLR
jgi:predicted DCC family thiol-disulfide oxidoreductase YuxK